MSTRPQPPPQNLLRPPPHHRPSPQTSTSTSTSTPSSTPRAPLTTHPTATISDVTILQGKHPISIGAGTIIHPRTRIYSTEGPISIGAGCIISEKCIIGTPPVPIPSSPSSSSLQPQSPGGERGQETRDDGSITISANTTLGPMVSVHPGTTIHDAVVVEAHAVIHRGVSIGPHSKVCARCVVGPGVGIGEWMVVWGVGDGVGLRRRVRGREAKDGSFAASSSSGAGTGANTGGGSVLEGRVIEDARLMVLQKEREALVRFIAPVPGGRRR